MPFLYLIDPDGSALERHPLRHGALVVGRSRTADVSLPHDATLSNEHFALVPAAAGLVIRDLGSTNGTWVNGERVRERQLCPCDRIRAGHSQFTVEPGLATMLHELSDFVIFSK